MTTQLSGGGAADVPVCPRHPDRESYVRCQRCERPTCPQCQRPAAVGIQCVDCVREQARSMPRRQTAFGGTVGTAVPWVTRTIIGLCVLAYLLQEVPGSDLTTRFEFVPAYATSEPWRLVTAAFLHVQNDPLHILFNMYALWLTGPYLEAQFGRLRFGLLYLISAVGGSIGYLLLAGSNSILWVSGTVGASGAVFGLFGAYFVIQRKLKREMGPLIAIIGINFALGFLPGVAWQAHLGGLITGVLATAALVYAPKSNRGLLQFAGLGVVAVLLAVAFAVRVAAVGSGSFY